MGMLLTLVAAQPGQRKLPLEILLGQGLSYGCVQENVFIRETIDEHGLVAFSPESLGRGFRVAWTPGETDRIHIRFLEPAAAADVRELYALVERVTRYWDARIYLAGEKILPEIFLSGLETAVKGNRESIRLLCREMLNSGEEVMELIAATGVLTLDRNTAEAICVDPEMYDIWLHQQQRDWEETTV